MRYSWLSATEMCFIRFRALSKVNSALYGCKKKQQLGMSSGSKTNVDKQEGEENKVFMSNFTRHTGTMRQDEE